MRTIRIVAVWPGTRLVAILQLEFVIEAHPDLCGQSPIITQIAAKVGKAT